MSCKCKTITCEYVSFGHPDKLADQISDAILDKLREQDPNVRAGIETMVKDNIVFLGGEVKTSAKINYDEVVRSVFNYVKYPHDILSPKNIKIFNCIGQQSQEISKMVDKEDNEIGAGDQGFVAGYASIETPNLMPLGHYIAKKICDYVSNAGLFGLGPDTKTQVVISYDEYVPTLKHILVSTMHKCDIETVREIVKSAIVNNKIGLDPVTHQFHLIMDNPVIDVNPCGEWHVGGPISDCGLTGRKIVVDQYGGYCNVGGGAFSGKDMSKVDRSAAYMARYLAKNIVASEISDTAKVEISYIIGKPEPCAFNIELDDDCTCEVVNNVKEWIINNVDLTPLGIINRFGNEFSYLDCARGAFWDDSFPWEKIDLAEDIKNYIEI